LHRKLNSDIVFGIRFMEFAKWEKLLKKTSCGKIK
jgi:hypothetical protein